MFIGLLEAENCLFVSLLNCLIVETVVTVVIVICWFLLVLTIKKLRFYLKIYKLEISLEKLSFRPEQSEKERSI